GLINRGDILLEPLRRSNRAKLAAIRHNDLRCRAALRSDAIDATNPGRAAHVLASDIRADTDNITCSSDAATGINAQGRVVTAGGVLAKGMPAVGCVFEAGGVL